MGRCLHIFLIPAAFAAVFTVADVASPKSGSDPPAERVADPHTVFQRQSRAWAPMGKPVKWPGNWGERKEYGAVNTDTRPP